MKSFTKKLKTLWWRIKSVVARYYYGNPSKKLKIVGVTGTNGKTTTATLLYRITTAFGHKSGLISTVENIIREEKRETNMTTPDSVALTKLFAEMLDKGCEYVFMEVSSHALEQNRVAGVNFIGEFFQTLRTTIWTIIKLRRIIFAPKRNFSKYFRWIPLLCLMLIVNMVLKCWKALKLKNTLMVSKISRILAKNWKRS